MTNEKTDNSQPDWNEREFSPEFYTEAKRGLEEFRKHDPLLRGITPKKTYRAVRAEAMRMFEAIRVAVDADEDSYYGIEPQKVNGGYNTVTGLFGSWDTEENRERLRAGRAPQQPEGAEK